ncbi:MAG: hypothetical protein NZM29_08365 [Nitrospira sp.]|nr:hypothetical protein [Nitrospira sp.]
MIKRTVGWGMLVVVLSGCATWPSTPPNKPFFKLNPQESKWLQSVVKKQEVALTKCGETNSCDRAYYVRALLGLYESRDVAERYFAKVLEVAPGGQLAESGKVWLQLLREYPAPSSVSWAEAVAGAPAIANANVSLGRVSERLVRDLLEGEAMVQQLRSSKEEDRQMLEQMVEGLQRELADRERKLESLTKKTEKTDSVSLQALQKQLAERDKKIEELAAQLEALKRIDQEMREKVRPIRPPSTVAPAPLPDQTP